MNQKSLPKDHSQSNTGEEYRELLNLGIPLYTTRLVRMAEIPFKERYKVQSPEDVATIMQDYFQG